MKGCPVNCVVEGPNWLVMKTLRVPKPVCSVVWKQSRKFGSAGAVGSRLFLLTGAQSFAAPRFATATTLAANWLSTVMPAGVGPWTPTRLWQRKWRMSVGICAGGGGATRLLADGTSNRT